MLPRLKRKRKDRRRLRTLDPARFLPQPPSPPPPPPPPPPALVHVLRVQPSPGEPTVATWVFDADVEDPSGGGGAGGSLAGLVVDGAGGIGWERDEPAALRIDRGVAIAIGQPWSNTAGAGGIVGTAGGSLAAGTGTVTSQP